jgi:two-component system KDP operon response regulator KdpE
MTRKRQTILIVDDELAILKFLRANLQAKGFDVLSAMDGTAAVRTVESELPDLLLLDIMMPKMDGFEVCRQLREWSQIPIIMLSAQGDEEDKVKCLELGADDYVTKPFGAGELTARVNAVLRRADTASAVPARSSCTCGNIQINFAQRWVTLAGSEVRLTPTEYSLLKELALNAGKVLTCAELLNRVWGPEYAQERQYLHVFIGHLRAKLEPDPTSPRYIITVPGVGYKFQASAE